MIRARLSNGVFVLGLDAENIKRLKEGKPIVVDLTPMGGKDTVSIVYGETMQEIVDDLQKASGQKLPSINELREITKQGNLFNKKKNKGTH